MKKARKLITFILTVVMVLSMSMNVWAAGTGSITINGTEAVPVTGKTFEAYQILGVELAEDDPEKMSYTVPEALEDFYANKFGLNKEDSTFNQDVIKNIELMVSDSDELFAFATAALAAAEVAENIEAKTGEVSEGKYVISDLPLGYYVIKDTSSTTPISALVLDTTTPNITVDIKADQVTAEKNILENNDSVTYNNAAIGDTIEYKITSDVPSMTGYDTYYFIVHDTMDAGLSFNGDEVVKIGDLSLKECTCVDENHTGSDHEDGKWYKIETSGDTNIKIVFNNFIQYAGQVGDAIEITYSATVDNDAVIGEEGNANTAKIQYSNNPNIKNDGVNEPINDPDDPSDDENDPTNNTPPVVTYTYVTGVQLNKVDTARAALKGATFKIAGDNLNTVLIKINGVITEADEETEYTSTVGDDGVLRFDGLSAGEYTITEIKAPEGYNLLTAPIALTIDWIAPDEGETDCTWTYTWNIEGQNSDETSNSIQVINNTGSELPSTGGIGTTIFYIVGGALVLFAVVLLVTKKRMKNEQ